MDSSMIGLRFKYNNNDMVRPEQSLFYNFGTTSVDKQKSLQLVNYMYLTETSTGPNFDNPTNHLMGVFTTVSSATTNITSPQNIIYIYLNELFNLLSNLQAKSITALMGTLLNTKCLVYQNLPKLPYMGNYGILTGNT
jgi:hypothetical protein